MAGSIRKPDTSLMACAPASRADALRRIDGEQEFRERRPNRLEYRDDPAKFLLQCHRSSTLWSCRFAADVNSVNPVGDHSRHMAERTIDTIETPTVAERIRRDVENAHNHRLRDRDHAVADSPLLWRRVRVGHRGHRCNDSMSRAFDW